MASRLINLRPNRRVAIALATLPFILSILIYLVFSAARLAENPNDKVLPAPSSFVETFERYVLEPDVRTGDYLLWSDTLASLYRLGSGVAIATLVALVFGIGLGLVPVVGSVFSAFVTAVAMVPPLAVLPILFIALGLGETAKIALIAIGIGPVIMRDLALRVAEIPREQLIKAQSLGASTWQIVWRIVLPQVLPRLIDSVRLVMGQAWLFLIAAEAIAAQSGLGYRIFLMRRYLSMDVILPYVFWITLLAVASDLLLRLLRTWAFPWARGETKAP
ncbi:MAG: ABC transporter permease subunit [Alphaproteobacteria bacterium]|nr:ABC transporter permease subunit [Alphaproteobacteria bacterium]